MRSLIEAAGGRTLALFTSYRAMDAAVEVLRPRLDVPVLTQRDLPKPALHPAFAEDEPTCLFATLGFWQGVDVPGRTLSLVTIDRIPFPRPDEPLVQARREAARGEAFRLVDLDRAATLLAQGAGRLIRSANDRGVVAVLDPRLAKKSYRWDLVNALPPMRPHQGPSRGRGLPPQGHRDVRRCAVTDAVEISGLRDAVAALWERRDALSPADLAAREVVESVVAHLDRGTLRTAEVDEAGEVIVHEWVKQAILLLFRVREMEVSEVGPFEFVDKVPLKSGFAAAGVRAVPGASCGGARSSVGAWC